MSASFIGNPFSDKKVLQIFTIKNIFEKRLAFISGCDKIPLNTKKQKDSDKRKTYTRATQRVAIWCNAIGHR